MTALKAFGLGLKDVCRLRRAVLGLWLVNGIFAFALAMPFLFLIQQDVGHSFLGNTLRGLNLAWLAELIYRARALAPLATGGLLAGAGLYLLLTVFLSGGLAGRLVTEGEKVSLEGFCGDAGRFFWRYLRLFLLSLPFYLLGLGLAGRLASAATGAWAKTAATEWTAILASNLSLLVSILALTIVQMIFDYAKILIAADNERRVLKGLGRALRFLGGRFFGAWGLYLITTLIFALGGVLFLAVTNVLPSRGLLAALAGVAWGQAFIVFRVAARALYFGTAFRLSREARSAAR
jgi:hypothetical protein